MDSEGKSGEELRDEILAALAAKGKEWLERARAVAESLARAHGTVNAEEVLMFCPIPEGISANTAGALFRTKEWSFVRYVKPKRPSSHASVIGEWELA